MLRTTKKGRLSRQYKNKGHDSVVPLQIRDVRSARARCIVPLRLEAPADAAGDAQVVLGLAASGCRGFGELGQ